MPRPLRCEALYEALADKDVPRLNELTDDLGADTRAARRAYRRRGRRSARSGAARPCPREPRRAPRTVTGAAPCGGRERTDRLCVSGLAGESAVQSSTARRSNTGGQ
ncbi:hypothetical protein CF640_37385 [Burkholderia pseudomallei]|nr:hypothetical protein CF640_37385 [Burkholderia pseudomallei]